MKTVRFCKARRHNADGAICVNPKDERYAAWIGKEVIVPIINRKIPIIADEYVDAEFGTGALKITPAHDKMLDRLIELGHAKDIWLEYDTNLTAINPRITDRWKHFKLVHVRASMDAIGEQYEIIRAGGKWKKFVAKKYWDKVRRDEMLQNNG